MCACACIYCSYVATYLSALSPIKCIYYHTIQIDITKMCTYIYVAIINITGTYIIMNQLCKILMLNYYRLDSLDGAAVGILSLDVIVVVVVVVVAATVVVILLLDIVVILISGNGVAIIVLLFDVMEAIPTPDVPTPDVSVMYSNNHAPSVLCTHLM